MLSYASYIFHHCLSLRWFDNGPACWAFLYNAPCGNVYKRFPCTRRAAPFLTSNWNLAVFRGPQCVVSVCSWSHFDAVHRHSIPTPLSLSSDNTQGPRLCWVLVGVLHWIHSVTVRWNSQRNVVSSRFASPLHADNSFACPQFRHASEVISPICCRISSDLGLTWRPGSTCTWETHRHTSYEQN